MSQMNLLNKPSWKQSAADFFTQGEEFVIKNKKCKVDYSYKLDDILIGFGYDLHVDDLKEDELFSYLFKDSSEGSLGKRMMEFYEYGNSPKVFLVSKDKIYYMPDGIRQTRVDVWNETENINELFRLLEHDKDEILQRRNAEQMKNDEDSFHITIDDLGKRYSTAQLQKLLKKPLWFEKSESKTSPYILDESKKVTTYMQSKMSRLCILNNGSGKDLKVKVDIYTSYRTAYPTFLETSGGVDTEYFILSENGDVEKSFLGEGETYSLLERDTEY